MGVINAVARFERDLLIECTQSGLRWAKAEEVVFGQPATLSADQRDAVRTGLAAGDSVSELAKRQQSASEQFPLLVSRRGFPRNVRSVVTFAHRPLSEGRNVADSSTADIFGLTARIVSAHVTNNQLGALALPSLIEAVYRSLAMASAIVEAKPAPPSPAVPWKKSVFPDFIICLEDGKKLKMLRRHLRTS